MAFGFSGILQFSTFVGVGLGFSPVTQSEALYWEAVVVKWLSPRRHGATMLWRATERSWEKVHDDRHDLKALGWGATGVFVKAAECSCHGMRIHEFVSDTKIGITRAIDLDGEN